jgi:hypothetical protein
VCAISAGTHLLDNYRDRDQSSPSCFHALDLRALNEMQHSCRLEAGYSAFFTLTPAFQSCCQSCRLCHAIDAECKAFLAPIASKGAGQGLRLENQDGALPPASKDTNVFLARPGGYPKDVFDLELDLDLDCKRRLHEN